MLTENEKIELINLRERSRDLILSTCNTVGCKDCGLKWIDDNGKSTCSSSYLEGQISDIEYKEFS